MSMGVTRLSVLAANSAASVEGAIIPGRTMQKSTSSRAKRTLMPAATLASLKMAAFTLLCCALLMVSAFAQTLQTIKQDPGNNNGPPPGAILDLSGTPVPTDGTYKQYTVSFTAAVNPTAITFAFRDDPSFISFANVSMVDAANPSVNLLTNGGFSRGTYDNLNGNSLVPTGWTYANTYGATFGGIVQSGSFCYTAAFCWYDGAVQAYDAISQNVTTVVGDVYQISFSVAEPTGGSFSELSTNGDTTDIGGNGKNVTVYAQSGLPPATQPLNVTLLDSGSGTVTTSSTPPQDSQINCSEANGVVTGTCSASYQFTTVVTLTAEPNTPESNPASTFAGWGGACASFGTNLQCTVTMSSAQNVTATFDLPAQSVTQPVNPGVTATFNYNGGPNNGGYDYAATEDAGGSTVKMTVTTIPMDPDACTALVQANPAFNTAKCFEFTNGGGSGVDAAVLFEVTCPPNGSCGSDTNQFNAVLASDFSFTCSPANASENQPLQCADPPGPFSFGLPHITYDETLLSGDNLPEIGFLKGTGPDPNHPCTPFPGNDPPLFQSNQIIGATIGDTSTKPIKAGSGGTTSCWGATYLTPGEVPSVTIHNPVNLAVYNQGDNVQASYGCSAVSSPDGSPTGPYLTVDSCTATDAPGGSVGTGCTAGDTSCNLDTTPGAHTFTAFVQDSATNTASQTVTYTVLGNQAPLTLNTSSPLAYGVSETLSVTGGSTGGTVTYNLLPGPCSIAGNQLKANSATGSCTLTATMAGNANYNPVTSAPANTVILAPAGQAITFTTNPPSSAAFNTTFTVAATGGGSLNPVVFSSAGACTVIGATYTMNNSTGTCSVIANQAGNANYSLAPTVTKNVTATGPLLSVTPASFNFGTVDFNFDFNPGIVTVKNIGTATANISNVLLTLGPNSKGDFTLINLCSPLLVPGTLAPGKTCYISVFFVSGNLGSVSATLKITDNAPGSPQQVTSTANVIGFTPSSLSFPTTKVGKSSTTQSVTLNNTGTTPVNITGVNIAGANAHDFVKSSSTCSGSLAAGHSCSVSVAFTPTAKGSRSASLTLTNNVPLGALIVKLSGTTSQ